NARPAGSGVSRAGATHRVQLPSAPAARAAREKSPAASPRVLPSGCNNASLRLKERRKVRRGNALPLCEHLPTFVPARRAAYQARSSLRHPSPQRRGGRLLFTEVTPRCDSSVRPSVDGVAREGPREVSSARGVWHLVGHLVGWQTRRPNEVSGTSHGESKRGVWHLARESKRGVWHLARAPRASVDGAGGVPVVLAARLAVEVRGRHPGLGPGRDGPAD